MINKLLLRILFTIFLSSSTGSALGVPIVVSLDAPDKAITGTLFDVNINVSGLQSNGYRLGAFSLDFSYLNNDLFTVPQLVNFGDELGSEDDLEVINSQGKTDLGAITTLDLLSVSLLSDVELANLQTDDFITLATISLFAQPFPGDFDKNTVVVVDNIVLSDSLGFRIATQNDYVYQFISIPEPPTLALFVIGLIGIGYKSKKTSMENYYED